MTKDSSHSSIAGLTDVEAIFLASVNVVFSLIGIFGNLLVLFVVVRHRYMHTVTNMFIASLAIADLLVCFVAQPLYAIYLYGLPSNNIYSDVRKTFSFVSVLASISNLGAVTMDRYIAIVWPMSYELRVTCKRAAILLCVIWVVSLLLGIPAGIVLSLQRIVVYYVLALVIFIVPIYVRIYIVARRQARLIARQVGHLDRNSRSRGGKENVAAKTIGNVLTAFIICWLPLIVVPIVFRYIDGGPKVRKILKWVQTIGLCSSALNPVIYSLKTQIFKKDLRTIGRAIFRRRAWDEKPEIVWRNLSKETCYLKKPRHFFPYNWKQDWWVDDALDNLILPLPQFYREISSCRKFIS